MTGRRSGWSSGWSTTSIRSSSRRETIVPMLAVRAARFDEAVRDFIDRYPDGAVVELGCGLDTRWERCNGNRVDWFDPRHAGGDCPAPAVFAGRRKAGGCSPLRCRTPHGAISWDQGNVRSCSWRRPCCTIWKLGEVAQFLRSISAGFPFSSILLDAIGTGAMNRQDNHPLMRHFDARFRWAVDDVRTLVADNPYTVASSEFLADLRREELRCLPLMSRLLLMVMRRMRWFRESSRLVRLSSVDE